MAIILDMPNRMELPTELSHIPIGSSIRLMYVLQLCIYVSVCITNTGNNFLTTQNRQFRARNVK